jgi:hypothetical protein
VDHATNARCQDGFLQRVFIWALPIDAAGVEIKACE